MALDFAAGCIGGIAGVIAGHPFDTVKVKLQTQDVKNPAYRGTWHAFTSILKTESVRGLYKGVTSPMCGVAFINALLFGLYGNIQRAVSGNEETPNLTSHAVAGSVAGLAQAFISGPMELAKIRLQVQKSKIYASALHCLVKSYKEGGLREVYRGMSVTVMREVPSSATYFVTYEALSRGGNGSTVEMLLAGGMAGMASWFVTYPLDVVKTRIQSDGMGDAKPVYKGSIDCFRRIIAEGGYRSLFTGLNSTLVRAFPTNGVTFAAVAWTFKLYDDMEKKFTNRPLPKESAVDPPL